MIDKAHFEELYRQFKDEVTSFHDLFFGDEKHPLRVTGYKPAGQDEMSPDMLAAIPRMQSEVSDRLKLAQGNLGLTDAEIAEFWNLSRSSHSEVSKAVNHPENLTLDKALRICATLNVSPKWVRHGATADDSADSDSGYEVLSADRIASDYSKLNDDNKRVISTVLKSTLQAQRATERYLAKCSSLFCVLSDPAYADEQELIWKHMDEASYLSGVSGDE